MTDPLVPSDVDLRGYDYMPLYGERLFKSQTWIAASAEAKIAALRLWWHAYAHEVPAASLPNNDVLLSEYAGYGVAVKAWQRVKQQALHGFVECSDGRLYHPRLSEWAIEAWDLRVKERQRKANWRAKQRDRDGTETGTGTGQPTGQRRDVPVERKGSDVKRCEAIFKTASLPTPTIPGPGNGSHGAIEKTVNGKAGQDWNDRAYVNATAKTLGEPQRPGESFEGFRDRIFAGVQAKIRDGQAETQRRAS